MPTKRTSTKRTSRKRSTKRTSRKRTSRKRTSRKKSTKRNSSKRKSKSIPSYNTPSKNKRSPKPLKHNIPSPAVSATEHIVGTVKTGNDGNKYIVIRASNGTKRWVKNKYGGGNLLNLINNPLAKQLAHNIVDVGLQQAKSKGSNCSPINYYLSVNRRTVGAPLTMELN
jgi:hypothetical protein